jgi:CubicO group peptidase (beta-lactamase class C family)
MKNRAVVAAGLVASLLSAAATFAAQPAALLTVKTEIPGDAWQYAEPSATGWDQDQLLKAVGFAMSRKSSGVVVVIGGRIIAEKFADVKLPTRRYAGMIHGKDKSAHAIEDVASCQKSIASVLVGIAQEKGLLKISDPVHQHLGEGWSNASAEQERQITIRHLISMNSGLDDRLRFVAPPNTKWKYNTNAYCLSLRAAAAAAKMTPNELTKKWLTGPLGMKDSRWIERKLPRIAPPETNRLGFATTTHDLARFGLLVLRQGQWGKTKVLSDRDYLKKSTRPSQQINPAYGYLWWVNGTKFVLRGVLRVKGPLNAEAPQDMFAALGALGRRCYVVPSLDLIVTRLGDAPNAFGKKNFDLEFWRLLLKAAPKKPESE